MKASDSFKEYMSTGEGSFEEDREYIKENNICNYILYETHEDYQEYEEYE